jgi:protein-tyrosine phosphatase
MRRTAREHGIELTHRARQIVAADFEEYDYIIAMDESNRATIISHTSWKDNFKKRLTLMRSYEEFPQTLNVPDPYFGATKDLSRYTKCWKKLIPVY